VIFYLEDCYDYEFYELTEELGYIMMLKNLKELIFVREGRDRRLDITDKRGFNERGIRSAFKIANFILVEEHEIDGHAVISQHGQESSIVIELVTKELEEEKKRVPDYSVPEITIAWAERPLASQMIPMTEQDMFYCSPKGSNKRFPYYSAPDIMIKWADEPRVSQWPPLTGAKTHY